MRELSVSNGEDFQALVPWTGKSKNPQNSDAPFDHAPYFNFNDDKLKFDTKWSDNANDNYGSASGFLVPKSSSYSSGKGAATQRPLLSAPLRAYPPAEHPTNLVDVSLQRGVFFRVDGACFFHQPHEKAQKI